MSNEISDFIVAELLPIIISQSTCTSKLSGECHVTL
jgi:hypothetical protein